MSFKLLNKHSILVKFDESVPKSVHQAIDNVFDNFAYFLKFNNLENTANISLSLTNSSDFFISKTFIKNYTKKEFNYKKWLNEKYVEIIEEGNTDYIGTCFYLINCLQEYDSFEADKYNRFPAQLSFQQHYQSFEKNWILDYFCKMYTVIFKKEIKLKASSYFLSHDVDHLTGGIKTSWLLHQKVNRQINWLLKKQFNQPNKNITQLLKWEEDFNVSSTFFWLTTQKASQHPPISNADYDLADDYVSNCIQQINKSSIHNIGLHKSSLSSSIDEELSILNQSKSMRYHYLSFQIKNDYQKISESSIEIDCSLGFSHQIGFRNAYGLPFQPFNPIKNCYYDFIVFPLHIMDSALYYYQGIQNPDEMIDKVIAFFEKNKYSCQIGILWHNNLIEEKSYKRLLQYLQNKKSALPI